MVWGADANAHLPLSQSIFHVRQGLEDIGSGLLLALAFFCLAVLVEKFRAGTAGGFGKAIGAIDWKLLYFGFAPGAFLALRGTGLNPFVAMPAVFGFTLFGLAPVKGATATMRTRISAVAMSGLILACGWNAIGAVSRHVPSSHVRIDALKEAIELMRADAKSRDLKEIRFLTSHIWNFQTEYLRNVLIYEFGGDVDGATITTPDGIRWDSPHAGEFGPSVPVEWNKAIAGSGDAEKIETLFRLARGDVDYMLFPDDPTIENLEREVRHDFINLKVRAIKKRFLDSGEWLPVGGPLAITANESVQVYSKRRPQ